MSQKYAGSEIISSPKNLHSSFVESTATKLGVSPRTVQQKVQIAKKINSEVKTRKFLEISSAQFKHLKNTDNGR